MTWMRFGKSLVQINDQIRNILIDSYNYDKPTLIINYFDGEQFMHTFEEEIDAIDMLNKIQEKLKNLSSNYIFTAR